MWYWAKRCAEWLRKFEVNHFQNKVVRVVQKYREPLGYVCAWTPSGYIWAKFNDHQRNESNVNLFKTLHWAGSFGVRRLWSNPLPSFLILWNDQKRSQWSLLFRIWFIIIDLLFTVKLCLRKLIGLYISMLSCRRIITLLFWECRRRLLIL